MEKNNWNRVATPWSGWGWYDDLFLVDPDGNRYTPEMIQSSIYTLQLWQFVRNQEKFGFSSLSCPALHSANDQETDKEKDQKESSET